MTYPQSLHWPDQPALTAEDDNWHAHSPHWWETETTWWSFNVPERRMGGWFYTQVLAVQGICNGGAWVWDDSPQNVLYEVNHRGLPFTEPGDLRDCRLPNGNHVQMLEPLRTYRTTYSDPGALEADLTHEGIMAPHSHPTGAWPFWNTRHFDQPMHVTGSIRLHGEEIAIDCYSVRDRSWGPRPAGPTPPDKKLPPGSFSRGERPERARFPHSVGYSFGIQDDREAFLAFTDPWVDGDGRASDDVTAGYLLRGGEYAPLVEGSRTIRLTPRSRAIESIHLEAVDALGRELVADGEMLSRHGAEGPSGTGLFRWTWSEGCGGYGEDQSYGPAEWFEALDQA